MDFDYGWDALLQPGNPTGTARTYFDFGGHTRPRFEPHARVYHPANAWWLAELSRWIYRQETDETDVPAHADRRKRALHTINLREVQFVNNRDTQTQCAVVVPEPGGEEPFGILIFRGTHHIRDWLINLKLVRERWREGGQVHTGFREAFASVWKDVDRCLKTVEGPLFYTGHSLGAALAILAAGARPPQALYTFGAPLVGDRDFAESLRAVNAYRVVNNRDIITTIPPDEFGYRHAGELHYFTSDGRRLINPSPDSVAADRKKDDPKDAARWFEQLARPPEFLSDHSPCNYVAHLERDIKREENA